MRWKKLAILALVGVLGFSIGTTVKIVYEASIFKPYEWPVNSPPIIINCYGEDFSAAQLTRAIDYWTIRGQHIGFYEHNPSSSICENEWLEGFIILRKSEALRKNDRTLANTKRYTSLTTMRGAVIHYTPGAQNLDLINEHELGHALGFSHVEQVGHIMHPLYHKMGRDFSVQSK